MSVRVGAGVSGSDRVEITWTDNAIQKQWLEVITRANANTGLAQNAGLPAGQADVFFFGNAIGDTGAGNTPSNALVNALDESGVRAHGQIVANNIPLTNIYDFNRDGAVNAIDESIARLNSTNPSNVLKYLNIGSPPAAPQAEETVDEVIASALATSAPGEKEPGLARRTSRSINEPIETGKFDTPALTSLFERLGRSPDKGPAQLNWSLSGEAGFDFIIDDDWTESLLAR